MFPSLELLPQPWVSQAEARRGGMLVAGGGGLGLCFWVGGALGPSQM